MKEEYRKQVALLLDVLPEVAREDCFAMHGGTAINLFLRDMPRLSVDIDQRLALEHQFVGLSSESFTYSEFEHTRESLVRAVKNRLTQEDKDFIFGFKCLEPDWNMYDFEGFPAIQWKLENLRRFKQLNALGYKEAVDRLDALLQNG